MGLKKRFFSELIMVLRVRDLSLSSNISKKEVTL
jgi:hypothetical protein